MKTKFFKLGDLVEYKKGFAFKSSDYQNDGVRVIRISDTTYNSIKEEGTVFISKEKAKIYEDYELLEDDLIVSSVGSRPPLYDSMVGKVIKVPKAYEGSLLNQNAVRLRGKDKINQLYLYNQLKTKRYVYHIESSVRGNANQASITLEDLFDYEIPLPNIKEQDKIALILSTWDKAIELKEKLIEQKKEQKKGLMQKLLTGEVRLPGFDGEWKEVKLEKVVKKTKGKAIQYVDNGKFPAIDMEYLESGEFKNYSNDATVYANNSDVLLLWDGSRAGMAFTGIEGTVGSTFVKLECIDVNNVFLQKHLELNESRIQKLREGSGIPHVPKDFLSYYKINLPCIKEQNAIATVLKDTEKTINLSQKEIHLLKQQKNGLMQLLLTGKVRVQV